MAFKLDAVCPVCANRHTFFHANADTIGNTVYEFECPNMHSLGRIDGDELDWGEVVYARPEGAVILTDALVRWG